MIKTLLVIDDEPDILEIVAEQIELLGYDFKVLKAQNVDEAERLIPSCDAIISDIKMPNSAKLEKILHHCQKPVARITGHDEFHGDLVIKKPIDLKVLVAVIDRLQGLTKNELRG
ncbi:MAG: hypothetical protein RJB66_176 [Pseudomonadota bacterium]